MEMGFSHWMALESAMQGDQPRRRFSRATLRRVWAFARPHRRALAVFLLLSVLLAVLTVATPVLAGEVVDELTTRQELVACHHAVDRDRTRRVARRRGRDRRAVAVVADRRGPDPRSAPRGVRARAAHARRVLHEDTDRRAREPAQQRRDRRAAAFTWTLSGVVSNVITLALTLAVMLRLSWPITLLAMALLPVFVIPARRMGSRLAYLEREAADHNSAMTTQMTERFSAPGATLVKLFGRPRREESEFGTWAERVAQIGVRTAMGQWTFLTSLALVSSLALALVYGLGGYLALRGRLDAGTVVTLALLLTRLYAPLTALPSARVDAMSALVSFERVFEVLDLEPLIQEPSDPRPLPSGAVSVEFDNVHFSYPSADKVSLASLEEVATLDTRGGAEVLHGVSFSVEPGQLVALVGTSGSGKSTIASLAPRLYDVDSGAVRLGGIDVRALSFDAIRATLGMVTQDGHLFHDTVRENLLFARPDATDEDLWEALRNASHRSSSVVSGRAKSRFSRTVSWNRCPSWVTIPTVARIARTTGPGRRSRPTGSRPRRRRTGEAASEPMVDFPLPDVPTSATMLPGSMRNEMPWSTSVPPRVSSVATSSSEASDTLSADGYAKRTASNSTDTGPAGSDPHLVAPAISGARSSTSKTRSKLTSADIASTRALASAVSGA